MAGRRTLPVRVMRWRDRAVAIATLVGALIAAELGHASLTYDAERNPAVLVDQTTMSTAAGVDVNDQWVLVVQPAIRSVDAGAEAKQLTDNQLAVGQQLGSLAFVKPVDGQIVATFAGAGTAQEGIEIANVTGTPIVAIADGVITAAGPVTEFGLWVREKLSDGTILVYARLSSFSVHSGQSVSAGERIATMGGRAFAGQTTLHLEVHGPGGDTIDPKQWLSNHGVNL